MNYSDVRQFSIFFRNLFVMMVMSMITTMTMVMMTKMTMAAMCSGERGTRKQLFRLARPRQSNLISIIIAITMMITFADEDHDGKR